MATVIAPANTSVFAIRQEAREYIGISSLSLLPDAVLDQEINYFYIANIPESIKLDQLKSIYTFYTIPYVDTYPIDVNQYQSFREPVFIDGLRAAYYKDRLQFYAWWPKVRTYLQPAYGDGSTTSFNFTLRAVPIVRKTFMASSTDATGFQLICADVGGSATSGSNTTSQLLQVFRNNLGNMTPPFPPTSPSPADPLPNPPYNNVVGQINYHTGQVSITWPTAPAANQPIYVNFYAPTTGRPNSLLYWNNEIVIRPVPRLSHQVTLEAYQTPSQFLSSTNEPFLKNFKRYISLGVAVNILDRIGDTDRRNSLIGPFEEAQGRVLERQANEEIGQANATIFNQTGPYTAQYPYGGYWY